MCLEVPRNRSLSLFEGEILIAERIVIICSLSICLNASKSVLQWVLMNLEKFLESVEVRVRRSRTRIFASFQLEKMPISTLYKQIGRGGLTG